MWSLVLTTLNNFSSPVFQSKSVLNTKQIAASSSSHSHLHIANFKIAQSNLVDAVSPLGYSLKYPSNWLPFSTQNYNPDSDIFLVRSVPNKQDKLIVTITTTIRDFLVVPDKLPPTIKKFNRVAETYAGILSQTGYKISAINPLMINGKNAVAIITETPDKQGSTTVIVEGKKEKMVVSTSIYPIDNSIVNQATLEQVLTEIRNIQQSITIR